MPHELTHAALGRPAPALDGLRPHYVEQAPVAQYGPVNYKRYMAGHRLIETLPEKISHALPSVKLPAALGASAGLTTAGLVNVGASSSSGIVGAHLAHLAAGGTAAVAAGAMAAGMLASKGLDDLRGEPTAAGASPPDEQQ